MHDSGEGISQMCHSEFRVNRMLVTSHAVGSWLYFYQIYNTPYVGVLDYTG